MLKVYRKNVDYVLKDVKLVFEKNVYRKNIEHVFKKY